jgi:hypothetical protein
VGRDKREDRGRIQGKGKKREREMAIAWEWKDREVEEYAEEG